MQFRKPITYFLCAMSLAGVMIAPIAPRAIAQEPKTNQDQDIPKGLFFEQLSKPKEQINTGLLYWIELIRNGQKVKVSNKHQFISGDRIRFHVKPNIDGYAYILLSSGSRGEQSVLFPAEGAGDNNRVQAGKDYELPADGYLKFDNNPGTEKVTLLLSRAKIDATAFLSQPTEEATLIASSDLGSKDLVPSNIAVAFNPPGISAPKPHLSQPAVPETTSEVTVELHSQPKSKAKAGKVHHKAAPPVKKTAASTATPVRTRTQAANPVPRTSGDNDSGVTTIVKKDPKGVLYVNIALAHK